MAQELCKAKGDTKALGINWIYKFLKRHTEIKTKHIPPLDKERAIAQDPAVLTHWFELYQKVKQDYNIQDNDTYNMDEKGFMQGVIGKSKVMINKYEKKAHMTQCGSREWVSLIECVSVDGRILPPYIIFKAAVHQRAWLQAWPDANIAISQNGWTDNEIGYSWLEHFAKESASRQQGQYRLLILDGHASHISTAAIEFSFYNKIILLCLPPHTTHVLQPLDVGLFAPLATAYKRNIHSITRLGASYSIDKVDFLEQYQKARTSAFTLQNIQSAWEKVGLVPYKPSRVLDDFSTPQDPPPEAQEEHYSVTFPPSTPLRGTLTYSGPSGSSSKLLTPATTLQVQQIMRKAKEGGDLELMVQKVGKAATLAIAEATIQNRTNIDLLDLNSRKERKNNRVKGNYGNARVLNQAVLDERQAAKDEQRATKEWNKEWKFLGSISPQLYDELPKILPTAQKVAKEWHKEWQSLGSISTQIFEESRAATKRYQIAMASQPALPALTSPTKPSLPRAKKLDIGGAEQPPPRAARLIIRLYVRVTTEELKRGRWAVGTVAGALGGQDKAEGTGQGWRMGRGQRIRKPRRAA